MSKRPTPDQLNALKRFGAATIHEAQGMRGALDGALKPLDPTSKLAGVALTLDCLPCDNLGLHYALAKARPGDVLVADAKGYTEAGAWGDILSLAALKAGVAGLVIDGAVRDVDAIIDLGFPVFTRGVSIKGTEKNQPARVNIPILCGGQSISPGDIVVGDRDGLVVIAAAELTDVLAASEKREAKEHEIRQRITAGETTIDILGLSTRLERHGMA